jgi:hypothetical protein
MPPLSRALMCAAFGLIASTPLVATRAAQSDCAPKQTGARGFFMGSRVEASVATSPKPAKPRPGGGRKSNEKPAAQSDRERVSSPSCLGLGYSIYRADGDDRAVRASTTSRFRLGDRIRFVLESNSNAFLYVFESSADGNVMIFPDAALANGANRVSAHTLFEIPSHRASNPRLRWFDLTGTPGTQRLYFVVSREPLAGVPHGAALAKAQRSTSGAPWTPPEHVWRRVTSAAGSAASPDLIADAGEPQAKAEVESASRALRLARSDPEPSSITLGDGSLVVVTYDLSFD